MGTTITKSLTINGCAVYKLDANGRASINPNIDNTTISLPAISFESTDIALMGTYSVVDYSRVQQMEISVNIPVDNSDALDLCTPGVQNWKITWCSSVFDSQSGVTIPKGFIIYARGLINNIPNAEISTGGENKADVTMSVISIKKVDLDGKVYYNIDRSKNVVEYNGVNYSGRVNRLY